MDNIVEEFLKLGANPNIQNNKGVTPLMLFCANNNVNAVKVILRYHPDIDLALKDRWERQAIDYCFQELEDTIGLPNRPEGRTRPWGTAHALWAAREQLQTPFAVINADDFYGQDAYLQMARHLTNQQATELSLVAYPLQNTLSPHGSVNRGLCSCKDGRLQSVEEYSSIVQTDAAIAGLNRQGQVKTLTACDSVSMNFWGFPATVFPLLQDYMVDFFKQHGHSLEAECYLPDFVNHLLQKHAHQCQVLPTSSHWFGVTYPEDKGRVQRELQACIQGGDYPKKL